MMGFLFTSCNAAPLAICFKQGVNNKTVRPVSCVTCRGCKYCCQIKLHCRLKCVKAAIYLQDYITCPLTKVSTFAMYIHLSVKKINMEILEEQIIIHTMSKETPPASSGTRSHNPGLRALLAIKNFKVTLEKDYAGLLQIESELDELNKKGLSIIEAAASPEATAQLVACVQEQNSAVTGINEIIMAAKQKTEQNVKDGFPELWKQLGEHLAALEDAAENIKNTGLNLLPEAVHPQWIKEFALPETPLVQLLVSHVDSCRVLLQMIERYSPEELNTITQIIADKVPLNFTYEEALEYQTDYYKALVNFKKEFKEEKNLWDKFLDILAGGTHQPPSERVMMERWLDGEKGDL